MSKHLDVLSKQAKGALARGQYQDALKIYQRALQIREDDPEIHYSIATIYFLVDDLQHAMEHFKSVTERDPRRANAHINLGAVYHRLGQFEESVESLQRGLQLDPNRAEGYYNLAVVYKQLGHVDKAMETYRAAVRLNPRMYEAFYNMGNILLDQKQFAQAANQYRLALEILPNCAKAKFALETAQLEALATPGEETQGEEIPAPGEETLKWEEIPDEETQLPAKEIPIATKGIPTPDEAPPRDASPAAAVVPAIPPDPDRLLDPTRIGERLRDLHYSVVAIDDHSETMLNFLRLKVEESIRAVSICILTPNDPQHDLNEALTNFEDMVSKLTHLQAALQQRLTRIRYLSGELLKT
jgi:Tfp pilus assembly protein PilF